MGQCSGGLQTVALGIVSVTVVEQHDRSRRNALQRPLHDLLDARAITVPDAERPADGALAVRAGDRAGPRTPKSVRRAKIPRCRRTGASDRTEAQPNVTVHVERTLEVELLVEVAVIADLMPLVRDPSHKLGPALSGAAEEEKRPAPTFFNEGVGVGG